MFKKLKDKKVYKKYKELKADPQGSARLSLVFWLIIFVVIVIFARGTTNSYTPSKTQSNLVNGYEYTYSNDNIKVFGSYFDSKQMFIINNEKFYFDGENVYKVSNHNLDLVPGFDLSILKIDYDFILKVTDGIDSLKIGDYDRYIVPLTRFVNLYDGDVPVDSSELYAYNIIIDEYYQGDILNMVKIDLNSYYTYRGINSDGILTIDFYNMNNISDFSKEYERIMKVVK